jgi:hypothetical protein
MSPSDKTAQIIDEILHSKDRRTSNRMPIERDVRYKVLGIKRNSIKQAGSGRTLNISRSGMLITTETAVAAGERIQVSVSWPAQLRGVIPLKLVAHGHVVRGEKTRAAISIEKHEFKPIGIRGL